MSLKEKYTWIDFKREKGKDAEELKRTSPEGVKAFTAAKKAKIKEFVEARVTRFKKEKTAAEKAITTLQSSLKGLAEKRRAGTLKRISAKQHAIKKLTKGIERDQSREL